MRRRQLLAVTGTGLIGGLGGCLDALPGQGDTDEETGAPSSGSDGGDGADGSDGQASGTETSEGEELSGTVELRFDGEDSDEPVKYYSLVNGRSDMLLLATVVMPPFGDRDMRTYEMPYRIPSGEDTVFRVDEDAPDPELEQSGTWTESGYRTADGDVDVTATPVGVDPASSEYADARVQYDLPNPTDITGDDIREVTAESQREFPVGSYGKAGGRKLGTASEGFSFQTGAAAWTATYEAEVSGISDSETFTYTVPERPEVDVTVESVDLQDGVDNPTVTFTAQSGVPVVNAQVGISLSGPSVSARDEDVSWFADAARTDESTRTLISSTVGDDRIGSSRTVTFDYRGDIDYPLEDGDTLEVGIISGSGLSTTRHPVTHVERPLQELVD